MEEIRPSAKRRVVPASDTLHEAIEKAKRPVQALSVPSERKQVSELARIDRQLHLADLGLNQYQMKLEKGLTMEPEEQRLFLAHQDSIRKLEMARAALVAKSDLSKKTDLEIARSMIDKGMEREHVLTIFSSSIEVQEEL
jgi:hypothetical protein